MKADNLEKTIEYLKKQGIKTDYEKMEGILNRIIEFEIEGVVYYIEWWINQSYFKLKNEFSSPKMPFKFINVCPNSPTTKHRLNLCFYDIKQPEGGSFVYSEIPFGSFRIPFN